VYRTGSPAPSPKHAFTPTSALPVRYLIPTPPPARYLESDMSYNSTVSAEALAGQSISQELLDVAKAYVDSWSEYRWIETTITETLSGVSNSIWLDLRAPIISVTSLTIDDVTQTEDTDFYVRKTEGRLYTTQPWGHDNIVIVYKYGWVAGDSFYTSTFSIVKMAEVQVALFFKKNPLKLDEFGVEGITARFADDHIRRLLLPIPTPNLYFTALGGAELNSPMADIIGGM